MIDFSVVITVYNDAKEIKKLLDEISEQTLQPYEIVITDGGSKDATCNIIQEYDANIRLIKKGRLNISQGLNLAIQKAQSEWIAIMAVGNSYNNKYFESLFATLNEQKNVADGIYGALIGRQDTRFGKLYNQEFMKKNFGMPTNRGVLIKKGVFKDVGYFYENFVYAGEDAEFYRRARRNNKNFVYTDKAIVIWDTPQKYIDYFKQRDRYILSDLQMFSNKMILWEHKSEIGYVFIISLIILCNFITQQKWGYFTTIVFIVINIALIIGGGVSHCVGKNISAFTNIICLIKNYKYWITKNKIDEKYIIRKVIR